MLLADRHTTAQLAPPNPVIDTTKERNDMWLRKKHDCPAQCRSPIVRGLA